MNSDLANIVGPLVLGYLLGSIPTGVLVGRLVGQDPRESGSGNIGASNVARSLGKGWGVFTLACDAAKGAIAVGLCLLADLREVAPWVGLAAVIGHCFPVWLKFKGGKGVATAFGVVACLLPVVAAIAALVWIVTTYFSRIPALGSLAAAALFVLLPQVDEHALSTHLFTLSIALIILIRHVGNIGTLKRRWSKSGRLRPKK